MQLGPTKIKLINLKRACYDGTFSEEIELESESFNRGKIDLIFLLKNSNSLMICHRNKAQKESCHVQIWHIDEQKRHENIIKEISMKIVELKNRLKFFASFAIVYHQNNLVLAVSRMTEVTLYEIETLTEIK